jgi:hypothetical protein
MQTVQDKVYYKSDRIFDRINILCIDALGQSFVRIKGMPVLPHTRIFSGLPAVQRYSQAFYVCSECGRPVPGTLPGGDDGQFPVAQARYPGLRIQHRVTRNSKHATRSPKLETHNSQPVTHNTQHQTEEL